MNYVCFIISFLCCLGAKAWIVPQQVVELQDIESLETIDHSPMSKAAIATLAPTIQPIAFENTDIGQTTAGFQKTERAPSQEEENKSRIALASHYLQQDRLDATEHCLTEVLSQDEYHPEALRLLAFVNDRRHEPERALELLHKVKNNQRNNVQYISFLGYIYQKTGRYDLARQQYFRLLEQDPDNPAWVLGLSVALESEGQRESALEGYRRLQNRPGIDANVLNYAKEGIRRLKG